MNALSRLTPEQRAAVVLVSLQPEQAQPLAEMLGVEAMRKIQGALAGLPHLSEEEVLAAFADFITQLASWRSGLRGGEAESFDLLTKALGDALVEKIRPRQKKVSQDLGVWGRAGQLDPETIGEYVGAQHPTIAAIILDRLPADRVPEVLSNMPSERAVEAIGQLSQPDEPAPAAVEITERMIEQELLGANVDLSNDPKIAMLGETLGTLPSALREAALTKLQEVDDVRAAAIKASLLRIEDLPLRLPTKYEEGVETDVVQSQVFARAARDAGMVISDQTIVDYLTGLGRDRVSRDAMREKGGGTMTIRTSAATADEVREAGAPDPVAGDWVVIEVEDEGTGMDEATREKIFEPFFTTKPQGKGTGLGLAIVHRIVTDHQGTIRVEDNDPRGTRFVIDIPA